MKHFRKQIAIIIAIVIAISVFAPGLASAADVGGHEISSQGACVLDFETGLMIYGYNEYTPRVPASMTKLVAVYVIYDAIEAGEIDIDSVTRISKGVSQLSVNWDYSNVPLDEGTSVSVRELLDVVLIWSACAATVALGEALCGSEEGLVARMNEKVSSLGLNSHFNDCYGVSANNSITPYGMAMVARCLILEHPEVLQITSKKSVTFRGTEYKNTNLLLGESGVDGVKTGYTDAAGFCFTGTSQRGGRRIVAVTMGSTSAARFPDARILLDYGFANAESVVAEYNKTAGAAPTGASLILNGVTLPLNAYVIDGNHYFKLRDIAYLLRETESRFDVTWNIARKSVDIVSGVMYPFSADVNRDIGLEVKKCVLSPSVFFIDDVEFSLEAYLIDGNNYFKLRDLGPIFDFNVDWEPDTHSVTIDTRPALDDAAA